MPVSAQSPGDGTPTLSVIIPMYREAQRIRPTLDAVNEDLQSLAIPCEIILVDDGSDDDTISVVSPLLHEKPNGHVLATRLVPLGKNQGKGAAVRKGLAASDAPWRLMMDADGSNRAADVAILLHEAREADAGLCVGSRAMPGVQIKARPSRRAVGLAFRASLWSLGVRGIRDTQCGFKLYSADTARYICKHSAEDRFSFDVEHILLCRHAGITIKEVGLPWEHRDGSKVNVVSDGLKMFLDTARMRSRVRAADTQIPAPPQAAAQTEAKPLEHAPAR